MPSPLIRQSRHSGQVGYSVDSVHMTTQCPIPVFGSMSQHMGPFAQLSIPLSP